ncbi:unnamed protein product [Rotaria sp. Silwood2]|nr:unnamed protein product [Rotaria sp. Silwood2]CAF3352440.1 unnamed protein product [Rotaria sp. Silwood2]CAF4365497.1 unnamed protein product [Rotaria sp. Silwood2]CAF4466792.1 unnamed protein product [Rotaria sp. Silwood2]
MKKDDLKNIAVETERLRAEKVTLNGELQQTKDDLNKTEGEHRETRRKYETQKNKVETLRQNAEMLHRRNERLSINEQHIKERSNQKIAQVDKNTVATNEIKGKINAERLRLDNGQRTIETAKKDLITIKTKVERLDAEIVSKQTRFNEMKEELNRFHADVDTNEDQKAANYKRLEQIEKNLTGLMQHQCELQKGHATKIHNIAQSKQSVKQTVINTNTLLNKQKNKQQSD